MNLQLIQGQFNSKEAIDIIAQMIHVKIKFHENKINSGSSEEDIKYRESKIKKLQKDLYEFRKFAEHGHDVLSIQSTIEFEKSN